MYSVSLHSAPPPPQMPFQTSGTAKMLRSCNAVMQTFRHCYDHVTCRSMLAPCYSHVGGPKFSKTLISPVVPVAKITILEL